MKKVKSFGACTIPLQLELGWTRRSEFVGKLSDLVYAKEMKAKSRPIYQHVDCGSLNTVGISEQVEMPSEPSLVGTRVIRVVRPKYLFTLL